MRTKHRNGFIIVINDQNKKLTSAILVSKITASKIAIMLLEVWIMMYGLQNTISRDTEARGWWQPQNIICSVTDRLNITTVRCLRDSNTISTIITKTGTRSDSP